MPNMDAGKTRAPCMIAITPKPAKKPPIMEMERSFILINSKFEDIANKKIIELIAMLKKEVS